MAKIVTKFGQYSGTIGPVRFVDGEAETTLPSMLAHFRREPGRYDVRLEEAPFWTDSQAQLLREERIEDADWIVVIDQLNVALHARPLP